MPDTMLVRNADGYITVQSVLPANEWGDIPIGHTIITYDRQGNDYYGWYWTGSTVREATAQDDIDRVTYDTQQALIQDRENNKVNLDSDRRLKALLWAVLREIRTPTGKTAEQIYADIRARIDQE